MYDESYFGPGFFIIHKENDEITQYLKIYIDNNFGFPNYCLRAFSVDGRDKPDMKWNTIDFTFRSIEDEDNGLLEAFQNLNLNLNGNEVKTIDYERQGKNHFGVKEIDGKIILSISKEVWGIKNSNDFIDIVIGDNETCENYEAIATFYNALLTKQVQLATTGYLTPEIRIAQNDDIEQLLTLKLK